jgi:hypothetical protein
VQFNVTGAVVRDLNQDGNAEYRASIEGSFEAIDANTNGIFEKATLTLRGEAWIDRNSDGFPEDHSYATLEAVVLNTLDLNAHPDRIEFHLVATQQLDLNSDGLVDETRGMTVDYLAIDANSNGAFESTNLTVHASTVRDANHDGIPEYTAAFVLYLQSTDANDDGHPELVTLTARGSEVLDQDQNGVPEETAYLRLDAKWTDADSNGVFEKVDLSFRAERMTDPNQDGTPDTHEWISVEYHAEDVNQDGTMDNVYLLVEKHTMPGSTP